MTIVSLLIAVCVVALLYWAVSRILAAFGVGEPVQTVVRVLAVVFVILLILNAFGLLPGFLRG